jgi:hypothetical protein
MKFLIGLVIVVGFSIIGWHLYQYFGEVQDKSTNAAARASAPVEISGDQLAGLPPALDWPLREAEQHGAPALREFLSAHASAIKDPRRAWIELDYVVLAGTSDPGEARRVYAKVKARLTASSPVYSRLKQLEKTYE